MNKIVREHYPVNKLPEDLRELLDPSKPVTLVIEQEESPRASKETFRDFFGAAKERNTSVAEAVGRIRSLRDEWE
ncbi:MAG TPA: hypothetical protein VE423_02930 [Microvirga sp.]|jgi:hypothetical protein|nr:hypothetical protein [Microvirga sp.]